MAWENPGTEDLDTVAAAANLTGKETYLGALNSSGLAQIATGATQTLFVIYQGAAQGRSITRQIGGIARVIYGGAVNPGDAITANGSGQGVATTTTGNRIVGFARDGGAAGVVGSVQVAPGIL
jgi:hypothetical protein